ncbi:ABC transporter permease [Alteriqipengyuania sp. 357]
MLQIFAATLQLSIREIRRHLMRSILTTLGIIIGVAAVITMVTVGNGVTASVQSQISTLGSSNFIVTPLNSSDRPAPPFYQSDVDVIARDIPGVVEAAGSVVVSVTAFHNGADWTTSAQGANNGFLRAQGIELSEGRYFSSEEEASGKAVCLIGHKLKENLFVPGESPLGEQMRLGNISCMVIGTIAKRSQSGVGQDVNNAAIMPLKTVQRRLRGHDALDYFVVAYDESFSREAIQRSLVDLVREQRLLSGDMADDFDIIDTKLVNDAIAEATGALTGMVAIIAGISLLVGGIGIMNIMLVSVTERTREIGIRLAIGALAREVRMQFLTEAIVLCALGGLIGIGLAVMFSLLLTTAIEVPFALSLPVCFASFAFSALMGVVFGYYPAAKASRLDPIEALRFE